MATKINRQLGDYLEKIGCEIHDQSYTDAHGVIRPITRDEALARQIWKQALGYEEETTNADGMVVHRVYPPDPKMQQFLIERREGKAIVKSSDENEGASLLDKISELTKQKINDDAEKVIGNDSDTDGNSGA